MSVRHDLVSTVGPSGSRSGSVTSGRLGVLVGVTTRVHGVVVGSLTVNSVALLLLVTSVEVRVQVRTVHGGGVLTLLLSEGSAASGRSGATRLSLKGRSGRRSGRRLVLSELHVILSRLSSLLSGASHLLLVLRKTAGSTNEVGDAASVATSSAVLGKRLLGSTGAHAVVVVNANHGVTSLGRSCETAETSRRRGVVGILLRRHVGVSVHVLSEGAGLGVVVLWLLASIVAQSDV